MSEKDTRASALNLLSRREHSRLELETKLLRRSFEEQDIRRVLDALEENGLQSDERFAEAVVRQRVRRRQGPRKIMAVLMQKGVSRNLISSVIQSANVDWALIAEELARGMSADPGERSEQAKLYRRLGSRGFEYGHIRFAIRQLSSS